MRFRFLATLGVCVAIGAGAYALGGEVFRLSPATAETPVTAVQSGPAAAARTSYRVVGVGDIMMGSDWPTPIMDERVTPGGDPSAVLGPEISQLFRSGDVVFGNVEGTIHSSSDNPKACGNPRLCFTFRSPPFHADYLRRAGFTMVSNANNHSRDFGESGRALTYQNLIRAGLVVSGADTPQTRIGVQRMADGTTFALIAFGHNPGIMQVTDLARLAAIVREADRQADVVIVSCHIGAEGESRSQLTRQSELFVGENRGNPFAFGRAAVDAGADIVFCHGPHIPRAMEVYRGRFIAYSLGNFWTYGRFNLNNSSGLAPIADLQVGRDGALAIRPHRLGAADPARRPGLRSHRRGGAAHGRARTAGHSRSGDHDRSGRRGELAPAIVRQ